MRWFSSEAETKNGHSIVLQLRYKNVTILLGGDLNEHAERYLIQHYAGSDPETNDVAAQETIIAAAAATFSADFARKLPYRPLTLAPSFSRPRNDLCMIEETVPTSSSCLPPASG